MTVKPGCSVQLSDGSWWRPGDVIDPNHPEVARFNQKLMYAPRAVAELSGKLPAKEAEQKEDAE